MITPKAVAAAAEPRGFSQVSEQKTQPFSQSEIQARLARSRMEEDRSMSSTVPLDNLVVPQDRDIRILMRPLARGRSVSPGSHENCEWLALHAEVGDGDDTEHSVLAVTQTHRDIKFSVRIPGQRRNDELWCELYYDPHSNDQILLNRSEVPFKLYRVSQQVPGSPREHFELKPNFTRALAPGTWRIKIDDVDILDFRVLEKRAARARLLSSSSSSDVSTMGGQLVHVTGKRSFVADDDDEPSTPEKRMRPSEPEDKNEDGVIMFLPATTNPLVFPLPGTGKEISTSNGHPLIDMESDSVVDIPGVRLPGGAEIDEYTIAKRDQIAASSLSTVFTADHSDVPDGVIVVKVLKTRTSALPNNEAAVAKNVIRQADIWLRELQYQENLEHKSIVRLYGGDARFLSLYMEHVDARDLTFKGTWRVAGTDLFNGDRSDASRILRDIASALHYIHSKGLVHNDIKPGNILYSRDRGAVLCDLGLSTKARDPVAAGTPWYVPPEFIGLRQRGTASDVWALGVTMLYVLGKITWPDVRANQRHPRHLHWIIAKLNSRERGPQKEAVAKMREWLNEVTHARNSLDTHDKLERLVHGMLSPNPKERVTIKDIVGHFFAEQAAER
ncbi:kinase-like domain-containing protein [Apiosordaria backusii]|uniref:Kinase-like domain-containing protein n=1 Tax=Apiosordaria backusii TaxID=314023 RepID=A0AA40BE38_9PEZI|nr:kinase-like domain-containing protein [Apiosordaria backusii]